MGDEETKSCPNCKREIPAVNFTIHSVHCARNIKVCPVCKEPVPGPELDDHHQKMHKLLPCKQCGESVCGTDLEDHIRDSCANTVKSCRFCELELPRRELPLHEGYCGARTEQCDGCKEWVMIKYRQLHLDSNHGFIRLDDDPAPNKMEPPKLNRPYDINRLIINSNSPPKVCNVPSRFLASPHGPKVHNTDNHRAGGSNIDSPRSGGSNNSNRAGGSCVPNFENLRHNVPSSSNGPGSSNYRPDSTTGLTSSDSRIKPDSSSSSVSSNSGQHPGPISSNVRPDSSNTGYNGVTRPNSISGLVSAISRPDSSVRSHSTRPNFDIPGHSRVGNSERNQGSSNSGTGASNLSLVEMASGVRVPTNGVKKRTNDQPQINMDTSATKTVDKDLTAVEAVSRGAVKKRPAPQPPRASSRRDQPYYSAMQRQQREERQRHEQNQYNLEHGLPPVLNPAQKIEKLRKMDALQNRDLEEEYRARQRRADPPPQPHSGSGLGGLDEATRQEFMNLKPMSPSQFMRRFSSLQVSPPPPAAGDRFPEIKSSLKELRRGLNEVTAPYNSNNNNAVINDNERMRTPSPRLTNEDVQLPCEFCNMLVLAEDLVQHQTGCRPDLAQFVVGAGPRPLARPPPQPPSPVRHTGGADPLIPCEFCMEPLPVYLITEHQERCIQENMPV